VGGVFKNVSGQALAATVLRALVDRTGLDSAEIDDVILGQGYANGEAPAIGRVAALDAGYPISVPGMQIDRRCGSGLQAVLFAAMAVQTGGADLIVAGGADSMSGVEFSSNTIRWGASGPSIPLLDRLVRARVTAGGSRFPIEGGTLETAENVRREYAISRDDQDRLALQSHQRAVAAQDGGLFDDEIVPVSVPSKKGDENIDVDEHPRRDTSFERLAALRPIMLPDDPDATVTAGNSSGQNDGSAACIVTTREKAEALGLHAFARLRSWAVSGVDPRMMGIGPVPAVAKALGRAGLSLADMDLIELNEAFASQVIAVTREWAFAESDFDRLNVNGSGISLGHPIGATGARILATLLREMDRRGSRYGLETMCIGGGQGIAAVFERVA
jgi:acetyl-CoA C-acetyltransferase